MTVLHLVEKAVLTVHHLVAMADPMVDLSVVLWVQQLVGMTGYYWAG